MRIRKPLILCALLCSFFQTASAEKIVRTLSSDGTPEFSHGRYLTSLTSAPKNTTNTARLSCGNTSSSQMREYENFIMPFSQHYGVSKDLVKAIVKVESCFDTNAISKSGAKGLMQLMPGTAKELGVLDPHDPGQNLRAGIAYFSRLYRRFDYNHQLALAAYNAGPGAVQKHNGIPPYPETQDYVKKVLSQYKEFHLESKSKNAEQFSTTMTSPGLTARVRR